MHEEKRPAKCLLLIICLFKFSRDNKITPRNSLTSSKTFFKKITCVHDILLKPEFTPCRDDGYKIFHLVPQTRARGFLLYVAVLFGRLRDGKILEGII